jgi:hypothetical protein
MVVFGSASEARRSQVAATESPAPADSKTNAANGFMGTPLREF